MHVALCGNFSGSVCSTDPVETRLQSESFDTLDDLLGFQVEKL